MRKFLITTFAVLVLSQVHSFCLAKVPRGAGKLSNADYAPDEVLVILSADVNKDNQLDASETLAGVDKAIGGRIIKKIKVSRAKEIAVVKLPKGKTVEQAVAENWHKKDSRILLVEPNYRIYADAIPNDPSYGDIWALNNTGQGGGTLDADIDAPEAWNLTTGSSGVVIAVIDSGVDYMHPDLAANIWVNTGESNKAAGVDDDRNGYIDDVHGYDFCHNDGDPSDDDSHGTHCAGIIAAVGNNGLGVVGVNWQAKIMACRILDGTGSGWTDAAIEAIHYAVDNGASILSNSYSGSGYSESLKTAIEYARDHGVIFIAAAGNAGLNNDQYPRYPASYDLSNIVAVASTTRYDLLTSGSCYGKQSVDLGAPGNSILSTVPVYVTLFSENFQGAAVPVFTGTQMTSGGTNTWVTINSLVNAPNKAARADSATYPYSSNNDAWIVTPAMNSSNKRGLSLSFNYQYEGNGGDKLMVEVWDGSTWNTLTEISGGYLDGYYWYYKGGIPDRYCNAAMKVRFRWITNNTDNNYYGFELDDIRIQYISTSYGLSPYQYLNGTSMAAAYAAGTAGLLKAYYPGASVYELKSRLMMGDPIAALAGKTVSGRRLNAYSSLTASGMMAASPNSGESWIRGRSYEIEWFSVGAGPRVNIYWLKGGLSGPIATNVENTGSYTWTIPMDLSVGTDYKIRITDGSLSDDSDAQFEIRDSMLYFTERFTGGSHAFDLSGKSILFTPDANGYTACIQSVSALPTDPAGGTLLPLPDDGFAPVTPGISIPFFGQAYNVFYVGSNGFITFDAGNSDWNATLANHFACKRISALFNDLDPESAGNVSWKTEDDHVAVSWVEVPAFGMSASNTFQLELFTDGRVRITWLAIAASDGLVGLSNGTGVRPDFVEDDLSALDTCGGPICPFTVTGDLDSDCIINNADLALMTENWLMISTTGDLNSDSIVNMMDLALMAENWLLDCNQTPSSPACVVK